MTTISFLATTNAKAKTLSTSKMLYNRDIFLRALEPEDLSLLYEIENDAALWQRGANKTPLSRFALKQYLETSLSQSLFESGELRLVIVGKASGEALGFIDLIGMDTYHGRAEVGLVVKRQAQGQGYAGQALETLLGYAQDTLHLHQLTAQIATGNNACRHVFEKAGFCQCGLLRDWLASDKGKFEDVVLYQKLFLVP